MTEMKSSLTAGTVRRYGIEIGRDEPSHIHVPRRRRGLRPAGGATSPTWPADVGDGERGPWGEGTASDA